MIETQNLARAYQGKLAVWDLNLHIKQGEIFGLLGPNGAGKTTTVRMLTALIRPTRGQAVVNGYMLGKQNSEIRQTVGLLTETPGFYEQLSAMKNLEIYARLYGVDSGRVGDYLKIMSLDNRAHTPVATFSKGMKQRLAIARALLHDPQTVFLDEPTAGLDPAAARTVREYIIQLREMGRTVLLTTHNLDEAERLCDRIAVLNGTLLALDTPQRLRAGFAGRRVKIQIKPGSKPPLQALEQLDFVRRASLGDDGHLILEIEDPEHNNPLIIRWLVEHDIEIQYVLPADASLEEVYLELVN